MKRESSALARFVFLIGIIATCAVGGTVWKWFTSDSHLFHHDKLMYVESRDWASNEYKSCFSLNVDLDQPSLTCDPDAIGKVFKVRFDADTYDGERPSSTTFRWQCRKTEDDPAIRCEYQSYESK